MKVSVVILIFISIFVMRNNITEYENLLQFNEPRDGRAVESTVYFYTYSVLFRSDLSPFAQNSKIFIMRNNTQPQEDSWRKLLNDFREYRYHRESYSFKERKKLRKYFDERSYNLYKSESYEA